MRSVRHQMHFKRAQPEDAATLTAIAFAAKRHWGYPEPWIEEWRELLTIRPKFLARHESFAAVIHGRIVGFHALGVRRGQLYLLHLWVRPEAMGQGVGRNLFLHAVGQARGLGFKTLLIESDPNAEGFYLRMGAKRVRLTLGKVAGKPRRLPVLAYELDLGIA